MEEEIKKEFEKKTEIEIKYALIELKELKSQLSHSQEREAMLSCKNGNLIRESVTEHSDGCLSGRGQTPDKLKLKDKGDKNGRRS